MESQYIIFVVSLLLELSCSSLSVATKCPCEDASLCQPLSTNRPEKEVLGFVVSQHNWPEYNWTRITTIAILTNLSSELLCRTHSKHVRVVLSGTYPIAEMSNKTKRAAWIQEQLQKVHDNFADGINIDTKDHIQSGMNDSQLLTDFMTEVYSAFKSANKAYQVSFNIPWSPNCIDGRYYQFNKLANVTDYLVIKAYNEQNQTTDPCVVSANSGFKTTAIGILSYIKTGVDPGNLILGLPWFGYDYPCSNLSDDGETCMIEKILIREAKECSDAAGTQVSYSQVQEIVRNSSAMVTTNPSEMSPYFNYKVNGQQHQVWFDDPDSLSLKYMLARKQELRGVALWTIDSVSYNSSDTRTMADTAKMWTALDFF